MFDENKVKAIVDAKIHEAIQPVLEQYETFIFDLSKRISALEKKEKKSQNQVEFTHAN